MWSKLFDINFQEYKAAIYSTKIRKTKDKQLAEFNYKLLNNLLNNNKSVSTWNKNVSSLCNFCQQQEDTKHLIFECKNVKDIWKITGDFLKSNINWKHIVIGYFLDETRTTKILNHVISYVAYLIFKVKMKLRLENKSETEIVILQYAKHNLLYYYEIYKSCSKSAVLAIYVFSF